MFIIASQIVLCLLIATLIGAIIGYILGKGTCPKKACDNTEETKHELHVDNKEETIVNTSSEKKSIVTKPDEDKDKEESIPEEAPLLLAEAREGGKDNLQLIKGIGKVLEKALNEKGFFHFDQLANLTEEQTTWLDKSISFPGRIKREKWIEQAKELAERLTHDDLPK